MLAMQTEVQGPNESTPEAISQAAHDPTGCWVSLLHALCLAVQVFKKQADELNNSHDEGTKRNRAHVIPSCDIEACQHREGGHFRSQATSPVVLSDTVGDDEVSKPVDELVRPQQAKQVVGEHVLQHSIKISMCSQSGFSHITKVPMPLWFPHARLLEQQSATQPLVHIHVNTRSVFPAYCAMVERRKGAAPSVLN